MSTTCETTGNLLKQQTLKERQTGANGLQIMNFRSKRAEFPRIRVEHRSNLTRDVTHQQQERKPCEHSVGDFVQGQRNHNSGFRGHTLQEPVEPGRLHKDVVVHQDEKVRLRHANGTIHLMRMIETLASIVIENNEIEIGRVFLEKRQTLLRVR